LAKQQKLAEANGSGLNNSHLGTPTYENLPGLFSSCHSTGLSSGIFRNAATIAVSKGIICNVFPPKFRRQYLACMWVARA
jgi:hypothetical protein